MKWWTLRQLRSKDSVSRLIAVEKLSKSKDPSDVEFLLTALKDEDCRVREAAARAFREIKDKRAVRPLIEALNDTIGAVAVEAAWALHSNPDLQAVEPLIAALGNSDVHDYARASAASALEGIGDARAIEPLITALCDKSTEVRRSAAIALAKIGDARAIVPLLRDISGYLFHVEQLNELRKELVLRLGRESAVPLLTAALEDEGCAGAALKVLESIGWQCATDRDKALIAFAKRDTRQLAQLGSASLDLLVKGFRTWDDGFYRVHAAKALHSLGWRPTEEADVIWFALDTDHAETIPAISSEGLDMLAAVFSGERQPYQYEGDRRIRAIKILQQKGDERSVEILGKVLNKGAYSDEIDATAEALGRIGVPRALELLEDATYKGRWAAFEALLLTGSSRAAPVLRTLVKDKNRALKAVEVAEKTLRRSAKDLDTSVLREVVSLGEVVGIQHYRPDPLFDNFDNPENFPKPWKVEVDCSKIQTLAQSELMRRGAG